MYHKYAFSMNIGFDKLDFFCATCQKILAPAWGSGKWAFGTHARASCDKTATMRQCGPLAQFASSQH